MAHMLHEILRSLLFFPCFGFVLSTLATIASIAAAGTSAGLGIDQAVQGSGQASQGAQTNIDIANQELQRKNQIFQQLQPFFSQYLQQGSPYLQNIQRQGAEQNAQQGSNAAGQLRQTMQTSGMGYGPSGTTAAALGQLGQGQAQQSANTYLQNLLNNEQVKFQAAQGLGGLGNMFNGQNTVGQPPAPTQSNIGSSVGALGQVLQGLLGQGKQNNNAGIGLPSTTNPNAGSQTNGGLIPPATQGLQF